MGQVKQNEVAKIPLYWLPDDISHLTDDERRRVNKYLYIQKSRARQGIKWNLPRHVIKLINNDNSKSSDDSSTSSSKEGVSESTSDNNLTLSGTPNNGKSLTSGLSKDTRILTKKRKMNGDRSAATSSSSNNLTSSGTPNGKSLRGGSQLDVSPADLITPHLSNLSNNKEKIFHGCQW